MNSIQDVFQHHLHYSQDSTDSWVAQDVGYFDLNHWSDFQQRDFQHFSILCKEVKSHRPHNYLCVVAQSTAFCTKDRIDYCFDLFFMCYCSHPIHRTGQSGVLWREPCSSPGLSPQVACFSDPWPPEATHARTLSMTHQCHQSVNPWSGRGSQLSFGKIQDTVSHTLSPREGCSRWLNFLIWIHFFVHWSSFQVSYCSDATKWQSSLENYNLPSSKDCSSIKGVLRYAWSRNPAAKKKAQSSWWVHLTSTVPLSLYICMCVCGLRGSSWANVKEQPQGSALSQSHI